MTSCANWRRSIATSWRTGPRSPRSRMFGASWRSMSSASSSPRRAGSSIAAAAPDMQHASRLIRLLIDVRLSDHPFDLLLSIARRQVDRLWSAGTRRLVRGGKG